MTLRYGVKEAMVPNEQRMPGHASATLAVSTVIFALRREDDADLATVWLPLVRRIRDRNEWDDVFVDALCTPPVSFTFGSVFAHILTVSVIRRQTVIDVMRELGVPDVEARDPIEWERAMAARS